MVAFVANVLTQQLIVCSIFHCCHVKLHTVIKNTSSPKSLLSRLSRVLTILSILDSAFSSVITGFLIVVVPGNCDEGDVSHFGDDFAHFCLFDI
jgi:hypothetical protein